MKTVIVGHGPSMLRERNGAFIDGCDRVIRLKRSDQLKKYPKYFGSKTTVCAGSLWIFPDLANYPADEYWILYDSRHRNTSREEIEAILKAFRDLRGNKPTKILDAQNLCNLWDSWFLKFQDQYSEEEKYPHLSQGMKALVLLLEFLPEDGKEEVHLIGFDNVASGERTWSVTRGRDWEYPPHNWKAEHDFIGFLNERFSNAHFFLNHNRI
jgi:hypothetical protein